ncbi:MAG: RhuM family protein [Capsulimonadaceae bacterium]
MSDLFGVAENTITYHLKEIFSSGELNLESVTRKIRVTATDGKSYLTGCYNLDAIISVGYRVNSHQATQFRIWATQTA